MGKPKNSIRARPPHFSLTFFRFSVKKIRFIVVVVEETAKF
jgi:hypothetical protein